LFVRELKLNNAIAVGARCRKRCGGNDESDTPPIVWFGEQQGRVNENKQKIGL
jgi:hypothetical protein